MFRNYVRRLTPVRWLALLLAVAAIAALLPMTAAANGAQAPTVTTTFSLKPNPKFVKCLAQFPADPTRPPTATVAVTRGSLNDVLTLNIKNIKPNLAFDLFTVQRSNLLSNGTVKPGFTNFGLAWYQSDVHANSLGTGTVRIQTILLDQIFGFDPDNSLAPTNTFHVGFWFNKPSDAQPCSATPITPTPFNGEHNAGPLGMISVPNAVTGLGPLCTKPNTSTVPATCNP
jgi:hypothetical protein